MGAEEWSSHDTQQTFREVAEYNQQMANRQASVGYSIFVPRLLIGTAQEQQE